MTKQVYDHVSRTPAEVKIRSNFEVVHLLQICLNKAVVHLLHYKSLFTVVSRTSAEVELDSKNSTKRRRTFG